MLNDEVDEVRISVFKAASRMKETLVLDEYTTNCIVFNLWEHNPEIWISIYNFLEGNVVFDEIKLFMTIFEEIMKIFNDHIKIK